MTKRYPKKRSHIQRSRLVTSIYGILVLLLFSLGLQFQTQSNQVKESGSVLAYASDISAGGLQVAQNARRTANGLGALGINSKLNDAAQEKANDMVSQNYWSHYTPAGDPPWVFVISAGYSYEKAGENLAYGFDSSSAVVTGWMNSSTHRANVLDPLYAEVGFGVANGVNFQGGPNTIVVAMYAQPRASTSAPAAKAPNSTPVSSLTPAPSVETLPLSNVSTTLPVVSSTPIVEPFNTSQKAEKNSQRVSGLTAIFTGSAPWQIFLAGIVLGIAILWYIYRHSRNLRRAIRKGERYALAHPLLELGLITIGVLLLIWTTVGVIR
ncbi:MAG: CAP domain-containing protein [bacterium]